MIHKIMAGNSLVSLEVKQIKSEILLLISKSDSKISFNYAQAKQLNEIIQSIDPEKYTLKEYGKFSKWSEIFKISISEFRGIKSLQIRERLQSPTYSGFGKQWIALPTYKLKELQMHLKTSMQEFIDISSNTKE